MLEMEQEIAQSFPKIGTFKSSFARDLAGFMQCLDLDSRYALGRALVTKAKASWDNSKPVSLSTVEKILLGRLDLYCINAERTREAELQDIKSQGRRVKYVGSAKLKKYVTERFKVRFGGECSTMELGQEGQAVFERKCCGWIISTQIIFDSREVSLRYSHAIETPTRVPIQGYPDVSVPTHVMRVIEFWLVFNSWDNLQEKDMAEACEQLIECCARFYSVAPSLLEGLELHNIIFT